MYVSLPRGGTMLVLYIIILQKDNTHSICTQNPTKPNDPQRKQIIPKFPQRNQRKPNSTPLRCCIFAS